MIDDGEGTLRNLRQFVVSWVGSLDEQSYVRLLDAAQSAVVLCIPVLACITASCIRRCYAAERQKLVRGADLV